MNILNMTMNEVIDHLGNAYKRGRYHAEAIYREVFRNNNIDFSEVCEFQKSGRLGELVGQDIDIQLWPVVNESGDGELTKFVSRADDGLEFETVIIPMKNYKTICVSSQVGCKMGCTFCETAQLGLLRNLTAGEIVSQVYRAKHTYGMDVKNIVFMGMGEPLDNFDNVIKAINILCDNKGMNFTHGNITISTVGDVAGIRKLGELNWPNLKLAVSLHAADDEQRSRLMPVNQKYPLSMLKQSLLEYPMKDSGIFFIEYTLIKDENDSYDDAKRLAEFCDGLSVKINLIPYNPRSESPYDAPENCDVDQFHLWLDELGLFSRRRITKGQDVMAACGQLGNKELRREKIS